MEPPVSADTSPARAYMRGYEDGIRVQVASPLSTKANYNSDSFKLVDQIRFLINLHNNGWPGRFCLKCGWPSDNNMPRHCECDNAEEQRQ